MEVTDYWKMQVRELNAGGSLREEKGFLNFDGIF